MSLLVEQGKCYCENTNQHNVNYLGKLELCATNQQVYTCDLCAALYTDIYMLEYHINLHTCSIKQEQIERGDDYVESSVNTEHNMDNVTMITKEAYPSYTMNPKSVQMKTECCNSLNESYSSNMTEFTMISSLKSSSRNHSNVCTAAFNGPSYLQEHSRQSGEKPYSCEVCAAEFAKSSHLKDHTKIHTGEKTYKCKVCNAEFARSSQLKDHTTIHSREKPLKCDVCPAAFIRPSALKDHIHNTSTCKSLTMIMKDKYKTLYFREVIFFISIICIFINIIRSKD